MIAIYGATGTSGRQIAIELAKRGSRLILGGRDRHRLGKLANDIEKRGSQQPICRVAELTNLSALRSLLDGARVVINCAGPFDQLGTKLMATAIEGGTHYIDIGSEQSHLRSSYEQLEAAAHHRGIVCVNGLAYEVALGDWAAAFAARLLSERIAVPLGATTDHNNALTAADSSDKGLPIDELFIAYAIRRVNRARRGQASSTWGLVGPTMIWNQDRWETRGPASSKHIYAFGQPFGDQEAVLFPGGEVITVPRHLNVKRVETFLRLEGPNPFAWETTTRLAPLLSPLLAPLLTAGLGRFIRAQLEAAGPRWSNSQNSNSQNSDTDIADEQNEFVIIAQARSGFEQSQVLIRGRNPLSLTGEICSAGALALVNRPPGHGGVLAPSQVFDPRARLYSLAAQNRIEVLES